MDKEILSVKEFCKKTGLAEYVVRRLINEGYAVTFKCGNKVYLHYEMTIKRMFNIKQQSFQDKLL